MAELKLGIAAVIALSRVILVIVAWGEGGTAPEAGQPADTFLAGIAGLATSSPAE